MDIASKHSIYGQGRRQSTRHVVKTPAYASLSGSSQTIALELCEILNISESGLCIQALQPMTVDRLLPLALDFSETGSRIHVAGHVVWTKSSGKTGIRFSDLPEVSRQHLQRWLEVNKDGPGSSGVDDSHESQSRGNSDRSAENVKPGAAAGYTSLITEWIQIEKEVQLFGPNLEAGLHLIAERALALTWATGAAISLGRDQHSSELFCEARAGNDSPQLGACLDASSGFSGECIRSAKALICDDTEIDPRVEDDEYSARGIRSLIACPIKTLKGKMIGILEVFSTEPAAFWDNDAHTLEQLARITARAIHRERPLVANLFTIGPPRQKKTAKAPPSTAVPVERELFDVRNLPITRRAALFTAGIVAVMLAVWFAAPWMSEAMNRLVSPPRSQAAETNIGRTVDFDYVGMSFGDLSKTARSDNGAAQYALALRYAGGDGVAQDYHQALTWFLKSAENGNIRAPGKIASCFWAGKGAPQDYSKAYFWGLLAQARGDETGRIIAVDSASHLDEHKRQAEQTELRSWLSSHHFAVSATNATW